MSDPVCLLERVKCFLVQGGDDGRSECLVCFLVQEDEFIAFLKIFVVEQPPSGCFFSGEYLLCEMRGEFEGFHKCFISAQHQYSMVDFEWGKKKTTFAWS